ncbi:MAG: undecaprenyl-diphosphate phosphatase [Clostridia bacterium]|nr:undecaprenyl-diphosphate phosphatase [Clostridia bacterium]MBO7305088.1 undecaprenyl-diphosphate phosphatase [Clostridia bacterium]
MFIIEVLKTILLGIVEGITEWLPVSSTGHMILLDEFINLDVTAEFKELFLVVVQLGAIAAVVIMYFSKLNPFSKKKDEDERRLTWSLWGKVIVGAVPAAIIGFLLDDILDEYLYNYVTVAITLIVYGVLFIVIEKLRSGKNYRVGEVDELTYKDALLIGCFQVLSLIPGTSRSGSTILGGMTLGVSRKASSEFSFFMAIPIMLGASLLKIAKFGYGYLTAENSELYIPEGASGEYIALLLIGMVISFVVSVAAIKFLMDFVKRHSFIPFGVYRIALGIVVIGYFVGVNYLV